MAVDLTDPHRYDDFLNEFNKDSPMNKPTIKSIDPQNITATLPIEGPLSVIPMTPLDILNRAVANSASIEVIERLARIYETWQDRHNRMAWIHATAKAKAEIPVVIRNATGHNSKKYADFAAIARVVDPILSKHGLYYNFRSRQEGAMLFVTCILSHEDGHFEETTLGGPSDTTGNKNAIQAIGSTATYLQRYTLVQMLGLATGVDDDGNSAGLGEPVNDEQLSQLETMMHDVGANFEAFCKLLKVDSLDKLPARQYDSALALLKAKGRATSILGGHL